VEKINEAFKGEVDKIKDNLSENTHKLTELEISTYKHSKIVNESLESEIKRFERIVTTLENHLNSEMAEVRSHIDNTSTVYEQQLHSSEEKAHTQILTLKSEQKQILKAVEKIAQSNTDKILLLKHQIEDNMGKLQKEMEERIETGEENAGRNEKNVNQRVDAFASSVDLRVREIKSQSEKDVKELTESVKSSRKELGEELKQRMRGMKALCKALVDKETAERAHNHNQIIAMMKNLGDEMRSEEDQKLVNLEVEVKNHAEKQDKKMREVIDLKYETMILMEGILQKVEQEEALEQQRRILVKVETHLADALQQDNENEQRFQELGEKYNSNLELIQENDKCVKELMEKQKEELEGLIEEKNEDVNAELAARDTMNSILLVLEANEKQGMEDRINLLYENTDKLENTIGEIDSFYNQQVADIKETEEGLSKKLESTNIELADLKQEVDSNVIKLTVQEVASKAAIDEVSCNIHELCEDVSNDMLAMKEEILVQVDENRVRTKEEATELINQQMKLIHEGMDNLDSQMENGFKVVEDVKKTLMKEMESINNKLDQSTEELNGNIASDLKNLIKMQEEKWQEFDERINQVSGDMTTQISTNIDEINKEFDKVHKDMEIEREEVKEHIHSSLTSNLSTMDQKIDSAIEEAVTKITTKYDQSFEQLNKKVEDDGDK
jgi:hypothetical protein